MSTIKWWGYEHTNGTFQAKRWFGNEQDIREAISSPFVSKIVRPFVAGNRTEALKKIELSLN